MGDDRFHFPRERDGCYRQDPASCCAACWLRVAVSPLRALVVHSGVPTGHGEGSTAVRGAVLAGMVLLGLLTTALLGGFVLF